MAAKVKEVCDVCGRPFTANMRRFVSHSTCQWSRVVYVTPEHGYYGCDTGCCGTYFIGYDAKGHEVTRGGFDFSHFDSREEVIEEIKAWLYKEGYPDTEIRIDEDELRCVLDCPN